MDKSKITAVTEWPRTTTVKELQRFLGFANFYRRFIRNYSITAVPLTSLLKGKPSRLKWTENATQAFTNLKNSFTTAPILKHPDPNLPFVVEVDAVLSQCHGQPGKLFPCAYFSRKLTDAECNYDVGNKEFLAMKATIKEWRHWLEGSTYPFQDTNPPCSRGRVNLLWYLQSMTGFGVVGGYGTVLMYVCKGLSGVRRSKPIDDVAHILPTNLDRGSGSPHGTSSYGYPAGS
ncbi:hypothetical protein QTP70_020827 [Hemibagrus guttatus]|uniref:Reverse transcriptase/retrotransposon-derived protein RNase H-like domain-containing protein n=1 Tax=Hemibagrus guttatus TaxID=175788 RepID=A0AAE0REN5_9TELE|nr:hypothetical protein QTP70_020827 [Hemibagrus guttatus]